MIIILEWKVSQLERIDYIYYYLGYILLLLNDFTLLSNWMEANHMNLMKQMQLVHLNILDHRYDKVFGVRQNVSLDEIPLEAIQTILFQLILWRKMKK